MTERVTDVASPKILAIGIVMSLIGGILTLYSVALFTPAPFYWYYGNLAYGGTGIVTTALFMTAALALVSLLQPGLSRWIGRKEFALIYAMVMTGVMYCCLSFPLWPFVFFATHRVYVGQIAMWGAVTPSWVPGRDALSPMLTGGAPVPWGELEVFVAVLLAWALLTFFYTSSLNMILRRQLIEVERLEFPHATVAATTISLAERASAGERVIPKRRLFYGFVLGFIFWLQFVMNQIFAWFPSFTAAWLKYPWIPWHPGLLDLVMAVPQIGQFLPGTEWYIYLAPFIFGIYFLAPLSVLLTAFIFHWIGQVILPSIFIWMGMYSGAGLDSGGAVWNSMSRVYDPVVNNGMLWGLAILPLVLRGNWKSITGTIRAAVSGPTKDERENEAMPYRFSWALMVITFVAFVIFLTITGMPIYMTFLWMVMWTLFVLSTTRLRGSTGLATSTFFDTNQMDKFFYHNIPELAAVPSASLETSTNALYGFHAAQFVMDHSWDGSPSFLGAANLNMEAYALASLSGVKPKEVFKAELIALIPTIVVSVALVPSILYGLGLKAPGVAAIWGEATGSSASADPAATARSFQNPGVTTVSEYWAGAIVGFVSMGLMIYARMRIPAFPLHPAGMWVGMSWFGGWYGFGLAFGVLWFIKWLVFKVGGVKLYESWGVPLATGSILGYVGSMVLWGLTSIATFR